MSPAGLTVLLAVDLGDADDAVLEAFNDTMFGLGWKSADNVGTGYYQSGQQGTEQSIVERTSNDLLRAADAAGADDCHGVCMVSMTAIHYIP